MIAKNHGNITNLKITNRSQQFWEMLIDVEVRDLKHLTNIIAGAARTPAINSVEAGAGHVREYHVTIAVLRLGVNIDHVATIRNARGGRFPDPVRAAKLAAQAGADGITAHLREDRRHISDSDIERLTHEIDLPLNFEMATTPEMLAIALKAKPHAACLVPEKREERTTEGGLDIVGVRAKIAPYIDKLSAAGIRVSLFIEPEPQVLDVAKALGAPVVELHTGAYCEAYLEDAPRAPGAARAGAHRARAAPCGGDRPGMPRRPRPDVRHGGAGGGAAGHRRAQYRPLPGRRSDLQRPRQRHPAHALADGHRRAPKAAARAAPEIGHDPRASAAT